MVFNGAGLSPGRRDYLGQGHQDLWFLTFTAVIKPETLLEMKNRHCGDHLLFTEVVFVQLPHNMSSPGLHLQPPIKMWLYCRRDDGRRRTEHQQPDWLEWYQNWRDGKHACVGSSAGLRLLLGAKAKGQEMSYVWMLDGRFKTWKSWWGLHFFLLNSWLWLQLHL